MVVMKSKVIMMVMAFMIAVTGLFGVQMVAPDTAEAAWSKYCGKSYVGHRHIDSQGRYYYMYTYYGGGSYSNAWNEHWYWTSGGGWDYVGWAWQNCYI